MALTFETATRQQLVDIGRIYGNFPAPPKDYEFSDLRPSIGNLERWLGASGIIYDHTTAAPRLILQRKLHVVYPENMTCVVSGAQIYDRGPLTLPSGYGFDRFTCDVQQGEYLFEGGMVGRATHCHMRSTPVIVLRSLV